jgi:hypothetical protein
LNNFFRLVNARHTRGKERKEKGEGREKGEERGGRE